MLYGQLNYELGDTTRNQFIIIDQRMFRKRQHITGAKLSSEIDPASQPPSKKYSSNNNSNYEEKEFSPPPPSLPFSPATCFIIANIGDNGTDSSFVKGAKSRRDYSGGRRGMDPFLFLQKKSPYLAHLILEFGRVGYKKIIL